MWRLSMLVLCLSGCGDSKGTSDEMRDTSGTSDDVPDTSLPDAAVDDAAGDTVGLPDADVAADVDDVGQPAANAWQAVAIEGCDGLSPGDEDCHYRLMWRPAACGGACSRLLIYWAGGEQSCAAGAYDVLLEKWADSGVLVACAQPFSSSDEAGRYPYADELERMDLLTRRMRVHAGSAWDGRFLAIGGVSHGATAPVAAIASGRVFRDRPEVWTGREGTAVILFDGISDPARLEASMGLSGNDGCDLWHARFVGRYGGGAQLMHHCDDGACFCAGGGSGWERDTTVIGQGASRDFPASPYGCDDFASPAQTIHYRVVSCGGGQAEPCGVLGDIIPDDQQTRLSDALTTCSAVTSTYFDHPGCAHTLCGAWDFCGGERARDWLTSLGW